MLVSPFGEAPRQGARNGQKRAAPSQVISAGATVKAAASATARERAIVGALHRIVVKLEKPSMPKPTIRVEALATRAGPTRPIAARSASTLDCRRPSSSRYRATRKRE